MRQYCFNRTADFRLLWELRARTRTEERMYKDFGTEPHSVFKSAVNWLLHHTGGLLFVWIMMVERHKTLLYIENKLLLFLN